MRIRLKRASAGKATAGVKAYPCTDSRPLDIVTEGFEDRKELIRSFLYPGGRLRCRAAKSGLCAPTAAWCPGGLA